MIVINQPLLHKQLYKKKKKEFTTTNIYFLFPGSMEAPSPQPGLAALEFWLSWVSSAPACLLIFQTSSFREIFFCHGR